MWSKDKCLCHTLTNLVPPPQSKEFSKRLHDRDSNLTPTVTRDHGLEQQEIGIHHRARGTQTVPCTAKWSFFWDVVSWNHKSQASFVWANLTVRLIQLWIHFDTIMTPLWYHDIHWYTIMTPYQQCDSRTRYANHPIYILISNLSKLDSGPTLKPDKLLTALKDLWILLVHLLQLHSESSSAWNVQLCSAWKLWDHTRTKCLQSVYKVCIVHVWWLGCRLVKPLSAWFIGLSGNRHARCARKSLRLHVNSTRSLGLWWSMWLVDNSSQGQVCFKHVERSPV